MIPEQKTAAIVRGLYEALGVTTFEDPCLLTAGASASPAYRIVVRGTPYLLRIITKPDSINDPTRQFTIMNAAAGAGLAPHVWYTSVEDGICITDFVESVPLPASHAIIRIPRALRTLHALTPYPKELNYITVDKTIRRFEASNIFPKVETDEIFARYAEVSSVYPHHTADIVSCHDDLKPENILFDGDRVWLVGWKAAFANDRYFDLAVIANFVIANEADESLFLAEYFQQPADEYQRARFYLMRQIMHMMYAAFFLLFGSQGKPVNRDEELPSFRDLHRRIWEREIDVANGEFKTAYATVHWKQLLHNTRQPQFDEALRIVIDRNVGPEGKHRLLPQA